MLSDNSCVCTRHPSGKCVSFFRDRRGHEVQLSVLASRTMTSFLAAAVAGGGTTDSLLCSPSLVGDA